MAWDINVTVLDKCISNFNTDVKLYIIKCDIFDYYKIGYSDNINKRLSTINVDNPFPCYLIKTISSNNIKYVEKYIHNILKNYKIKKANINVSTEWFKLDDSIIDYFMKIQSIDGILLEELYNKLKLKR